MQECEDCTYKPEAMSRNPCSHTRVEWVKAQAMLADGFLHLKSSPVSKLVVSSRRFSVLSFSTMSRL
jgi:hypothetical protein